MKKKIWIIGIVLFIYFECIACYSTKENESANAVCVSPEEFMNYYMLTEADVPKEYVTMYLEISPKEIEDLKSEDLGEVVVHAYKKGNTFGYYNLDRFMSLNKKDDNKLYNIDNIIYLIVRYEEAWNDGSNERFIFVDINENIIYFDAVLSDYRNAEIIKVVERKDINRILERLDVLETTNWESRNEVIVKPYCWEIYLIDEHNEIIYFEGYMNDEETTPGFTDWLQSLHKLVK